MIQVKIANGKDELVCESCGKDVKTVYVWNDECSTCLDCIRSAYGVLSAVASGFSGEMVGKEITMPVKSSRSDMTVIPVDKIQQSPIVNDVSTVLADEFRKRIKMMKNNEESGGMIGGSDLKVLLGELGIREDMRVGEFTRVAREEGIPGEPFLQAWKTVLANKSIERNMEIGSDYE